MRRFYPLVVIGCLSISLVACGKGSEDTGITQPSSESISESTDASPTNSYADSIKNGSAISEFETASDDAESSAYYDADGNKVAVKYDDSGNPVGDYYDSTGAKVTVPSKGSESSGGSGLNIKRQAVTITVPKEANDEEVEALRESAAEELGIDADKIGTVQDYGTADGQATMDAIKKADKGKIREQLKSEGGTVSEKVFGYGTQCYIIDALKDIGVSEPLEEVSGSGEDSQGVADATMIALNNNIYYHGIDGTVNTWATYTDLDKVGVVMLRALGIYTTDDIVSETGATAAELDSIAAKYIK